MNKEHIPYKESLELKELGFNESCYRVYGENKKLSRVRFDGKTDTIKNSFYVHLKKQNPQHYELDKICAAPLYQQVFRWFREKHRLCCQFAYYHSSKWGFEILEFTDLKITPNKEVSDFNKPRTYEEAELECLKELIKFTKNKQ
jgi:hypothetical protein